MAGGLAANYTACTGHHGTQLWAKKTRDSVTGHRQDSEAVGGKLV